MKRKQERLDDLFSMMLRQGDGAGLWRKLEGDPLSSRLEPVPLCGDDLLLRSIDRFVEKHRLAIATAHCRFLLRKWHTNIVARQQMHHTGNLPLSEPPVNL